MLGTGQGQVPPLHEPVVQKPPWQHGWPESPQRTQWSKSHEYPRAQDP